MRWGEGRRSGRRLRSPRIGLPPGQGGGGGDLADKCLAPAFRRFGIQQVIADAGERASPHGTIAVDAFR